MFRRLEADGRAARSQELPRRVVVPGMDVRIGTLSNLRFHETLPPRSVALVEFSG